MNAMTRVSLRNLRAHKVRLVLTLVAVVLGTAFIAGSFVFTDTLSGSFSDIFKTSDQGIDAQVRPTHDYAAGVPTSSLAAIAAVPGVRAVQPKIGGAVVFVDAVGKRIDTGGAPSEGADWVGSGAVGDPPKLVSGRAPRAAGEIAVNGSAMSRYHLHVGEAGKLVVPNAAVLPVRIVGVYRIGYDTGGYFGALLQRAQAVSLFTDGRHVPSVDVAADRGVSEATLATRLRSALPAGFAVHTGKQVRDADTKGVADALSFVTYLLLGFGIVALVVGSFIIYNTFTMLVAQRQRELALLRAIGADRKQVRRSVVREAVIIGLVGSALGVGAGVALAYGLHALLDAFNAGLPSGGLVLLPRTVIVALAVGTVVTVLAALAPARRAARIAPVAAMREDPTPSAAGLRRRTVTGVVVGVAGIAATAGGVVASGAGSQAGLTALGLLAVCAAVLLLSPVFARWLIDPLGRLIGRPYGVSGRLARTNAVRNPRRTAATAFALTLGLVLVTGIAVVGASMKASLGKLFDDNVRADYILTTGAEVQVPLGAAKAAAAVNGVGLLTELHTVVTGVDGATRYGTAVDGALTPVLRVHMLHGSPDTSGQHMIVSETTAKDRHWTLGGSHRLTVPGRPVQTVTVTGIFADDELVGDWAVGGGVYRALTPPNDRSDDVALVKAAPGADLVALRAGLERATNSYYIVDVRDRQQFKGMVAGEVNGLLGLLYALLGLALVIAVLGIVNTQALSVVERRRELGMLRAIGMQRRQVRRTVRLESVLIAVFGALVGVVVGLVFGSLFTRTLRSQGLSQLSIPWVQALLFVVLAAVVGVLAALWPARRAARTPPLQAIAGG